MNIQMGTPELVLNCSNKNIAKNPNDTSDSLEVLNNFPTG